MKALAFLFLSGCGWLLDFFLFYVLITQLSLPSGVANLFSATLAAMSVFVVAKRFIFHSSGNRVKSFATYLIYTAANIAVWALLIQLLTDALYNHVTTNLTNAAVVAKVIVTPLSLASNFIVTRWLSYRSKK